MQDPSTKPLRDDIADRAQGLDADDLGPSLDDLGRQRQISLGMALGSLGFTTIVIGSYFCVFKRPRSNAEDEIGWLLWIVGSWLLGGGVSLTFTRPAFACLIALFTPGLTVGLAFALYWGLIILNAVLANYG